MDKKLDLNINPLVSLLAVFISCGKNSVYKGLDVAFRLLQSAVHKKSLEAMFKLTGYLSADRMFGRLHEISAESTRRLIKECNRKLKLPKKVVLAIDFTEKEYYGSKNHPEIMGSKGGKYVRRYIEVSTVKPALFINALPVDQLTNDKKELLTQLLDGFHRQFKKTKIELLLLDRGFFSKKVVQLLTEKNIPFIMPAVKNKAIKKLVKSHEKKEIQNRIRYEFGETTPNLLFLKIEEDTFVYMTNTRKTIIQTHILYRKRWQIETNFREQNKFTFKTCTKNFNIRYLAFTIAGLLFNAWQLTKNKLQYQPESYLYKQLLIEEILKLWQKITTRSVIKNIDYLLVA